MKNVFMRTLVFGSVLTFFLFIAGCSKNSGSNNTPLGTYFFTATFQGHTLNYNNQFMQRGDNYQDVGGYVPNGNLSQGGGIFLSINDTTPKSRILALANKTYPFTSSATVVPDVAINTGSVAFYHAMTTSDTSYNIKVNQIVYLKTDSNYGSPQDIYAISGSFKALMQDPNSGLSAGDAVGTFNIQCTAKKY